jgi:formylglycine-generating enzyme required for sulfatase activity
MKDGRATRLCVGFSLHLVIVVLLVPYGVSALAMDVSSPRASERFRECPECPSMTELPAGHFTMTRKAAADGRKDDDPEGMRSVHPARSVDIPAPFALGTYPVTRREYGSFVAETHRPVHRGCHIQYGGVWVPNAGDNWEHPGFVQTQDDPVVCVSWLDAQDYVRWLNEKVRALSYDKTPNPYRLPTWEEMEYATRAGTATLYYWGNTPRRDAANYGKATCFPCGPMQEGADRWLYTSPVGSFPASPWGLYDMAGNVWEWAEACRADPRATPPTECHWQMLHGGSWLTNPEYLQTGERSWAVVQHKNNAIGFRVARTMTASRP